MIDRAKLQSLDIGKVAFDEPMANHTTLRVGGNADAFVEPDSSEQLQRLIRFACEHSLPVTFIGGGSNLLVGDGGVRGIVVRLGPGFDFVRFEDSQVTTGGATSLNRLVRECAKRGFAGLEFAIGIPGTVGGAVFGNAGAAGGEVGASSAVVRCIDAQGNVHEYSNDKMRFGYRRSGVSGSAVIEATFELQPANGSDLNEKIKDLLRRRKATQPVDKLNAGCIFKNAPKGPAGKLIDEMGGKGMRVGPAVVSDLHANFIINGGGACAREVLELIRLIQEKFRKHYGFEIETEIRMIGDFS